MRGIKVLVTAGPTREYLDPVRFLSNPSSGKMGYALAEAAIHQGAQVTLISGPVSLRPPQGARYLVVGSAEEMYRAVMRGASKADIIIMAAAVSDWRPVRFFPRKMKKKGRTSRMTLVRTPDILEELGRRKKKGQILVGFAAETDRLYRNARAKLSKKNLDLIVANQVGQKGMGFEGDTNHALVLMQKGQSRFFPVMSKKKLASHLLSFLTAYLSK